MDDATYMRAALALAVHGRGLVAPNPAVGAVVVIEGQTVGEGWHEGPGTDHAEIVALRAAEDATAGATLYCTLEPCDHTGRTGPCTQAIIDAGVTRVVIASLDPDPISGAGVDRLRDAGIEVDIGVEEAAAARLIRGFLHRATTGDPLVILKMAATLDGKIALAGGYATRITSPESQADVHVLRAEAGAIVVGSGTALEDSPSLTVRDPEFRGRPPLRVVLDARGRLPVAGPLFDGDAATLMVTTEAGAAAIPAWEAAGVETLVVAPAPDGGVALEPVVKELGSRGIDVVLVEGGAQLAAGALAQGVVDHLVLYYAPSLLGGDALAMVGEPGWSSMESAPHVTIDSLELMGPDIKVEADVHRDR